MKKILGILATGCLALGATTASAIPLEIQVAGGGVVAAGDWELSGLDSTFYATESWDAVLLDFESWTVDINPGAYLWEISGTGFIAAVGWTLRLGDQLIHANGDAGFLFHIDDQHRFEAVAVPEPGTLALLGLGLWAVGFAASRRRVERSSNQLA